MYKPILSAARIAAAAVVLSMLAGCMSGVKKDSTYDGKHIAMPSIGGIAVVADLTVAETKVKGRAWGDFTKKTAIEKAALSNAFAQTSAGFTPDVLVAPKYFYEHDVAAGILTVTVVGYPARYKNFRPDPRLEINADIVAQPADSAAAAPAPEAYQTPAVQDQSVYQAPDASDQPVYQTPAVPPPPVYQAPAVPPPPAYQTPAPINILPPPVQNAPAPVTQPKPINTP